MDTYDYDPTHLQEMLNAAEELKLEEMICFCKDEITRFQLGEYDSGVLCFVGNLFDCSSRELYHMGGVL